MRGANGSMLSENIARPAISIPRRCICSARSTSPVSVASVSASSSATPATCRATNGTVRGAKDGAALHAPLLPLGQQQPASDDRIKKPQRRRGAGVILRVVDQHMTDRGGAVQGQLHAAE